MPIITTRVSIAAGAVNDNLLANSQFEFLPYDASLEFGINGDANGQEVIVDVYSGQDVLAESMPLNSQARFPVYPDDYSLTDAAAAGERLKVRARNTGAGAHVVFTAVRVTPL